MCCILMTTMMFVQEIDIDTLLAMHKAAVQSIYTLKCDMEIEEHNRNIVYKGFGTYVRSGTSIKAIENNLVPGRRIQTLSIAGVRKTIYFANGTANGAVSHSRSEVLNECDAWYYALFLVHRPNQIEAISLEELVQSSSNVKIRQASVKGRNLITLSMVYAKPNDASGTWEIVIDFDAAKN